MEEWVILQPEGLLLCGIAVFFCLFEKKYRSTKGVFFWFSGVFAILGTACSLLQGASARECAAVLMAFWLMNTGGKT